MDILSVFVFLSISTAIAQGNFYSFTSYGDTTPSIILQVDFSINIKAFKGRDEVGSFIKRSTDSEQVNVFGSIGPQSLLFLKFSQSIDWMFVFDTSNPTAVTLQRLIQFVPNAVFPSISTIDDVLEYEHPSRTNIGSPYKSHACTHESVVQYNPKIGHASDIHFTVQVTVRNLQIQATNVKNGLFSTAAHCDADLRTPSTTPDSTATAVTSKTQKTTKPITSVPTEAPIPKSTVFFAFTKKGDSFPSIILEADFSITIRAFKRNEQVGEFTKHSSNTENVSVFGSNGPISILYLRFSESIRWAFIFKQIDATEVSLDQLIQFVPMEVFPSVSETYDTFEYEIPGTTHIGSPNKSYACAYESTVQYSPKYVHPSDTNFTMNVTLRNFRVQAFNVKNGAFSSAVHCDADHATEAPITSPSTAANETTEKSTIITTPSPGTTPGISINKFVIRNNKTGNVCISLNGRIEFDINYKAKVLGQQSSYLSSHVGIPESYTVSGECLSKGTHESLTIFFFEDWYVKFEFERHIAALLNGYLSGNSNITGNTNLDYSISNITLSYTIDHAKFPFAVEKDGSRHTIYTSAEDNLPRKKKGQGYYKCNSGIQIRMGQNVNMGISSLRFKAFNDDVKGNDDDKFKGKPAECDADKPKEFDWPVLGYVLLAFFLLILIIVIIYLIVNRKRQRKVYQSLR